MKLFVVFLCVVFTSSAFSQNEWWKKSNDSIKEVQKPLKIDTQSRELNPLVEAEKDSVKQTIKVEPDVFIPGTVSVSKSPSIEKVIRFKSATIPPHIAPTMDGYRVQLFFDQSRSEVDKARSKAIKIDPKTPTYVEYMAPNYLLMLGDFREELDAEKKRAALLSEFPEAIIKSMKIYMPQINMPEEEKE